LLSERILSKFLKYTTNRYFSSISQDKNIKPPEPQPNKSYLLYAHIPFCESLCPYCSFNRFIYQERIARLYFINLRHEMELIARLGYRIDALYLGGGTPTILIDELVKTIELSRHLFDIQEVSCETNPNHLTDENGKSIKGYVQRLSVGVQSFNDGLLKSMNRFEKFGSGKDTLERIKSFTKYIPTLNIDLIFNFPNQTNEMLLDDIHSAITSGANQVTYYPLMTSPSVIKTMNTVFGKIDYSQETSQYHLLVKALSNDFSPSSAWTFSRKKGGLIDEYIVDYEEYIGIGSGAFSYLNGSLYVNTFSLSDYNRFITSNSHPIVGKRSFNIKERMQYQLLMELFGLKLDKKRFMDTFHIPIEKGLWKEVAFLRINNAFSRDDNDVFLVTPKGRYLLVAMMREFFSGINRVREQAKQKLPLEERTLTM
jgi:coproporphyrinogen III oxidase-like Fe-S oxidoreductase